MIEVIAVNITEKLIRENLIKKNLKEWYIYAFLRLFESVISIGTIFFLSIIFGVCLPTLHFWIFFNKLRKKTGGFHCEKYWQCYLGTICIYLIIVFLEPIISKHLLVLYSALFFSVLAIRIIGTVNHPNMAMNSSEVNESSKISRYILAIEVGIIIFFRAIGIKQIYMTYMSIAIVLCALLLCTAKILKQEVRIDYE